VRQQTPKIPKTGVNSITKKPPRMRFRELYNKRVVRGRYSGQSDSLGAKRAGYQKK